MRALSSPTADAGIPIPVCGSPTPRRRPAGLEIDDLWANPRRFASRAADWHEQIIDLSSRERDTLADLIARVPALFAERPAGLAHGDVTPVNVLTDGTSLTGLLDFDVDGQQDLPGGGQRRLPADGHFSTLRSVPGGRGHREARHPSACGTRRGSARSSPPSARETAAGSRCCRPPRAGTAPRRTPAARPRSWISWGTRRRPSPASCPPTSTSPPAPRRPPRYQTGPRSSDAVIPPACPDLSAPSTHPRRAGVSATSACGRIHSPMGWGNAWPGRR